jgi:hypothetical protein
MSLKVLNLMESSGCEQRVGQLVGRLSGCRDRVKTYKLTSSGQYGTSCAPQRIDLKYISRVDVAR